MLYGGIWGVEDVSHSMTYILAYYGTWFKVFKIKNLLLVVLIKNNVIYRNNPLGIACRLLHSQRSNVKKIKKKNRCVYEGLF